MCWKEGPKNLSWICEYTILKTVQHLECSCGNKFKGIDTMAELETNQCFYSSFHLLLTITVTTAVQIFLFSTRSSLKDIFLFSVLFFQMLVHLLILNNFCHILIRCDQPEEDQFVQLAESSGYRYTFSTLPCGALVWARMPGHVQ